MAELYHPALSVRRRTMDRLVTIAINGAGGAVILFIASMLVYLVYVAYPLAQDARIGGVETVALHNRAGVVGAAEGNFWTLPPPPSSDGADPRRVLASGRRAVALWGEEIYLFELDAGRTRASSELRQARFQAVIPAPGIRPASLHFDTDELVSTVAYYDDSGRLQVQRYVSDGLSSVLRVESYSREEPLFEEAHMLLDSRHGRVLLVDGNRYLMWILAAADRPLERIFGGSLAGLAADGGTPAWSSGHETLLVADSRGLHRFDVARENLPPLGEPIPLGFVGRWISSERVRRTLAVGDDDGRVALVVPTSGETLLQRRLEGYDSEHTLALSEDGAFIYQETPGTLRRWPVYNPSPETGWRSLWTPQWYGAYDTPQQVWHPDGAAIGVLSKFSLSPLVFGTFKAAIYGMLFAIPLALGAAVYTGYFMAPRLRNAIKPTVELLEAFPTVVLGFIAGLWLAPLLIDYLVPVLLLPVLFVGVPLLLALAHLALQVLSPRFVRRPPRLWLVGLFYVLTISLLLTQAEWLEEVLFGGSVRAWLWTSWGLAYEQRNALLVGMAMGVAITPTMFSLCEDAINAVPRSLSDGSLALGATRWQSLLRVVLPAASPAILSALFIGFARGLGETMIVLLATGNTPVLDANLFSGLQSISAAIAIELPEASVGSTHFRLLFLAALVLFALTFVLNTLAEVFRQRLRYAYGQL